MSISVIQTKNCNTLTVSGLSKKSKIDMRDSTSRGYEKFIQSIHPSIKNIYISIGESPTLVINFVKDVKALTLIDLINLHINKYNFSDMSLPQLAFSSMQFRPFEEYKSIYVALVIAPNSQVGTALEKRVKSIDNNNTFFEGNNLVTSTADMRISKMPHVSLATFYIKGNKSTLANDFPKLCETIKILFMESFHTTSNSKIVQAYSPYMKDNSNYRLLGYYIARSYEGEASINNNINYLKTIQSVHANFRDNLLLCLAGNANTIEIDPYFSPQNNTRKLFCATDTNQSSVAYDSFSKDWIPHVSLKKETDSVKRKEFIDNFKNAIGDTRESGNYLSWLNFWSIQTKKTFNINETKTVTNNGSFKYLYINYGDNHKFIEI
jgi:hypothetical protein